MRELHQTIERKFVDTIDLLDLGLEIEVENDSGWTDVTHFNLTVPYEVWRVDFDDGSWFEGADNHILFTDDLHQVFLKDLVVGQSLYAKDHSKTVIAVTRSGEEEPMADFTVAHETHRFYTANGLLHHNTTLVAARLLWEVIFFKDWTVAILANKMEQAKEVIMRVQMMYENLPFWLQQGVKTWNKQSFILENNSRMFCAATSASGIRGKSCSHVYLDEYAHIDRNKQEPFFTSTYPVVSSGKNTKITITSTPKGLEHFYKLWTDAATRADGSTIDTLTNTTEAGRNGFFATEAHWSEHPMRDEAWRLMTLSQMSEEQFNQEFECHFQGSSGTLISGQNLRRLVHKQPMQHSTKHLRIYDTPKPNHVYAMVVDTSRGLGLDYNAFVMLDCTQIPYKVVCVYQNNTISSLQFPNVIAEAARTYNDASVLVETNDNGLAVADALMFDLDVENVISTTTSGKKGQVISAGFGANVRRGIKTSKSVKSIGCTTLKTIIETDKIELNDLGILSELYTFSQRGASYEAEDGCNDDLVMCLVLFSWMTTQRYFKELTNVDLRKAMVDAHQEEMEDDLLPFGFLDDGLEDASKPSYRELLFGNYHTPQF